MSYMHLQGVSTGFINNAEKKMSESDEIELATEMISGALLPNGSHMISQSTAFCSPGANLGNPVQRGVALLC